MKKPRVLFLTEGENSPSARFAVAALLPYLEAGGIRCTIAHRIPEKYALITLPFFNFRIIRIVIYCLFCYPFSLFLRLFHLFKVRAYDIVFLQRDLDENHTTPWLERMFRRYSKRFIFYFDDALWLYKNHLGKSIEYKIQQIILMADRVIVSHKYLADYALGFNSSVLIFPLGIDTNLYVPKPDKCTDGLNISKVAMQKPLQGPGIEGGSQSPEALHKQERVTLGWSGGPWNYPELVKIVEELKDIKRETGADILIHSGKLPPPEIQGLGIIFVPWQKGAEVQTLQKIDIALCPLHDSAWSRGKFSIKLLQYMACGIPVVCSDVGVNGEIIIDGETGFLVQEKREWRSRLLTLIYDKRIREQMKIAARQRAVEYYCLEKAGMRLANSFISLYNS